MIMVVIKKTFMYLYSNIFKLLFKAIVLPLLEYGVQMRELKNLTYEGD